MDVEEERRAKQNAPQLQIASLVLYANCELRACALFTSVLLDFVFTSNFLSLLLKGDFLARCLQALLIEKPLEFLWKMLGFSLGFPAVLAASKRQRLKRYVWSCRIVSFAGLIRKSRRFCIVRATPMCSASSGIGGRWCYWFVGCLFAVDRFVECVTNVHLHREWVRKFGCSLSNCGRPSVAHVAKQGKPRTYRLRLIFKHWHTCAK